MSESARQDIVQKLMENAADIISASTDDEPERLMVLVQRQKRLKGVLESMPRLGPEVSRASIGELQVLLTKAGDVVRSEMGKHRGRMQATGVRKKVLRAYGTVTVSAIPSR